MKRSSKVKCLIYMNHPNELFYLNFPVQTIALNWIFQNSLNYFLHSTSNKSVSHFSESVHMDC